MNMGVYIGMEMPKNCRECRFCNGQANTDYGVCAWCDVDGKARDAYAMKDCPLIPVQPHGRLIDADAMIDDIKKAVAPTEYIKNRNSNMIYFLQHQETIIPAEEG